mmetsp:Transcript_96171/g.272269  ORF Transcript_96171/g.272269 Transcript_96171/m.272269 type:complete len:245 (+) Transcript_96171:1669-2403(+)
MRVRARARVEVDKEVLHHDGLGNVFKLDYCGEEVWGYRLVDPHMRLDEAPCEAHTLFHHEHVTGAISEMSMVPQRGGPIRQDGRDALFRRSFDQVVGDVAHILASALDHCCPISRQVIHGLDVFGEQRPHLRFPKLLPSLHMRIGHNIFATRFAGHFQAVICLVFALVSFVLDLGAYVVVFYSLTPGVDLQHCMGLRVTKVAFGRREHHHSESYLQQRKHGVTKPPKDSLPASGTGHLRDTSTS